MASRSAGASIPSAGGLAPNAAARAVRLNRQYRQSLGWQPHVDAIVRVLGFTAFTPDERGFADTVARWQRSQGLTADGVIGSITWGRLRTALGIAAYPRVNSPLPQSAPGLTPYANAGSRFGLPETIRALLAIGAAWQRIRPGGPRIQIGDLSLEGGGPIRGHRSHQRGVDVDIRPIRNDGVEGPVVYQSPSYSRALTQQLVDLIRANGVLRVQYIFFNDPNVTGVRKWPNHDNHLHVRFYPPGTATTPELEEERGRAGARGGGSRRRPVWRRRGGGRVSWGRKRPRRPRWRFPPVAPVAFYPVAPAWDQLEPPADAAEPAAPPAAAPSDEPTSGGPEPPDGGGEPADEGEFWLPRAPTAPRSALGVLARLAAPETAATVANALEIVRALSEYHSIPWQLPYTILNHEGGVRLFSHRDGVMQTTRPARDDYIPRIPRELRLTLLGRRLDDGIAPDELTRLFKERFPGSLAVQIAVGVQELADKLQRFSGYVALAFVAYNTGSSRAYQIATRGASKRRPGGVSALQWEESCRFGAALLHQSPSVVEIRGTQWRCDKNIPAWHQSPAVHDRQSGRWLPGFKYLRSIRYTITPQRPSIPCTEQLHKKSLPGSGQPTAVQSRPGALDKLYNPRLLGRAYLTPVASAVRPIQDDSLPLKVRNGRLVKAPLQSTIGDQSIPI